MPTLGCMLRAHRRAHTLDVVISEFLRYRTLGVDTLVHVITDRPTPEVVAVLDKYRDRLYGILPSPFPLVSKEHGELFMEASNLQVEALEPAACDFLAFGDDDHALMRPHVDEELLPALENEDVDLWYARTLFFQDRPDGFHPTREHTSPFLFRRLDGDRFPETRRRVIQATEERHDRAILEGRAQLLKTPLADYGTYNYAERQLLYKNYMAAGKDDAHVRSYIDNPLLLTYPQDAVVRGYVPDSRWIDIWSPVL